MSELAFNMNGEPFDVPDTATGWRVRRVRVRGAPEVVYGRDGVPLVLPIDAGVEDLRQAVDLPGRYRVDPVEDHRAIPNAPAGYVYLRDNGVPDPAGRPDTPAASDPVVEAMRLNAEIAKAVVVNFPPMMHAAATLLQAADGAGLPRRLPPVVADDGDGDDESGAAGADGTAGNDTADLISQLVPVLLAALQGSGGKLDLASLIDWRRATKSLAAGHEASSPPALAPLAIEPSSMAHLLAIHAALEPHEVAFVKEVGKELDPDELRGWLDELGKLSVPDAVTRIRDLIAGKKPAGGAR